MLSLRIEMCGAPTLTGPACTRPIALPPGRANEGCHDHRGWRLHHTATPPTPTAWAHNAPHMQPACSYVDAAAARKLYLGRLRSRYPLTEEDFDAMVLRSCGRCEACGLATPKLFVDHCHTTEGVRGLLCLPCNFALGRCHDDRDCLLAQEPVRGPGLADYLATHPPTIYKGAAPLPGPRRAVPIPREKVVKRAPDRGKAVKRTGARRNVVTVTGVRLTAPIGVRRP